ncbi:glycine--tRNA ligase subunit alpha [Caulobacter segnis]
MRFVEDDWENPDRRRFGAWAGSLVRRHGSQPVTPTSSRWAALDVPPVAGELTYGLERLAMYVFGVDNVYDLPLNDPDSPLGATTPRRRVSRRTSASSRKPISTAMTSPCSSSSSSRWRSRSR